jgi:polygalacturonase
MYDRRDFIKLLGTGSAGIAVFPQLAFAQADPWKTVYPRIIARIRAPKFRNRDFLITRFGAVAGTADATDAIRKAIDACSKAGAGALLCQRANF